jgi:hypothetical protein
MADFRTSIKTLNSAVRTILLIGLTGVFGFGGWFGYANYVRPGFEAKQAKADLAAMQIEFSEQGGELKATQRLNERLETSMRLLKVDRRIANIRVMEKGVDETGEPYMEVRFFEVDDSGKGIGKPRDFRLAGEKFYVDGWIATFEDKYVETADELRSASMFVFKSIYGDAEKPRDGQRLDVESQDSGVPGIYKSPQKNDFEQKIWSDFWAVSNDLALQKELGIRASQGQASYLEAVAGKTYQVSIRASGGMSLRLIEE